VTSVLRCRTYACNRCRHTRNQSIRQKHSNFRQCQIKQTPPATVSPDTAPPARSPRPRSHPVAHQSSDRMYPDPQDMDTHLFPHAQTSMSRDPASSVTSRRSDQRQAQAPSPSADSFPQARGVPRSSPAGVHTRVRKNLPPTLSEIAVESGWVSGLVLRFGERLSRLL